MFRTHVSRAYDIRAGTFFIEAKLLVDRFWSRSIAKSAAPSPHLLEWLFQEAGKSDVFTRITAPN